MQEPKEDLFGNKLNKTDDYYELVKTHQAALKREHDLLKENNLLKNQIIELQITKAK